MPVYQGSCHCGQVRFQIDGEIDGVTQCDCSLCRKKNALMGAVHESGFTLLSAPDSVSEYRWNTGIARHFFCPTCGIYTFHKKRSMPDHYGFNIMCLDDFDPSSVPVRAASGQSMSVVEEGARPEWRGPRGIG